MATQDTTGPPSALRNKYQSPEPAQTSSMTPPPSSQAPQLAAPARTPTPTHSHLSSPPPTLKGPVSRPPSDIVMDPGMLSPGQIAGADADQLRNMINELTVAYREARASAAHQKLQYNLLWMESDETMKRMQVELEMAQKEVEVLQQRHQLNPPQPALATPVMSNQPSPSDHLLNTLRNQCYSLELENDNLRQHLAEVKTVMIERENAMAEENERLRERIRTNRKHANLLRRSIGPEQAPYSAFTTPQPHSARRHPQSARSGQFTTPKAREGDPFAALLMADQVLSQEAATTPSTPTGYRPGGHTRGAHSLSSMPSTPYHARTAPQPSRQNHSYYSRNESPLAPRSVQHPSQQRRRESRDSTISASEVEAEKVYDSDDRDDISESQASREATNLLRKSTQSSFGSAATKSSGKLQTKLYGQVKKPGVAADSKKRKAADIDDGDRSVGKKGRMSDGFGLGIGGWAS